MDEPANPRRCAVDEKPGDPADPGPVLPTISGVVSETKDAAAALIAWLVGKFNLPPRVAVSVRLDHAGAKSLIVVVSGLSSDEVMRLERQIGDVIYPYRELDDG